MFVLSLVKKHYRLQFYMVREIVCVCERSLGLNEVLQKLNRSLIFSVRNQNSSAISYVCLWNPEHEGRELVKLGSCTPTYIRSLLLNLHPQQSLH